MELVKVIRANLILARAMMVTLPLQLVCTYATSLNEQLAPIKALRVLLAQSLARGEIPGPSRRKGARPERT